MAATINTATQVLVLQTAITDAVTANYDQTVTRGLLIFNTNVVKTAAPAGFAVNVQLQTGAGVAITDNMNLAVAQNVSVPAATIDDTTNSIASGGTLRYAVTNGGGGNGAVNVAVYCIPA